MKKIFLFLMFFFVTFINVYAEDSYITSIKIDGNNLEGFESSNFGPYEVKVDTNKTSIKLGYLFATGYKMGQCSFDDVSIKYGTNELKCEVVKSDGSDSKTYQINVIRPDNRSSNNSLTSLTVGNNKVILSDTDEYNVSVDSKVNSVEVKATLPDGATFIDGYGERTGTNAVKLSGETTSLEIKVKAENESIRTYKINVKKSDYKNNDASLKSLTIEGVDLDFKKNTLEYNVSVKYNISKIKIEALKNDEKATVEYQEDVNLKIGLNNLEIKVRAEDGSEKIYKLNITREEEIPIVSKIEIAGIDFTFDPKTYNYKIETTLSQLDFNVTLRSDTATSKIENNENLKNGSTIEITANDGDETATYKFKIVNKEETIKEEKEATNENDNQNFFKKNEMLIALIIFGIGIFSVLAAVLVKTKSKKV